LVSVLHTASVMPEQTPGKQHGLQHGWPLHVRMQGVQGGAGTGTGIGTGTADVTAMRTARARMKTVVVGRLMVDG